MNVILKSLFAIVLVSTLVVSSTTAYFSDTEISQNNIFIAGKIDLRVDSEAHYNGKVCRDDVWVDPDEEENPANVTVEQVQDGSPGIGNADVECTDFGFDFGIVRWSRDTGTWGAEGGEQFGTELSGDENDINWDVSTSTAEGIIVKAGNTVHYGIIGESANVEQSQPGLSHITFCGFEPPPACDGTWSETDLQDGEHILFNFENLLVGDHGENTLSLRVYDNDSWARMMINIFQDVDNGCVEPELDDDADCEAVDDPGAAGELRENMLFTLWFDQGSVPGFQNTNLTEDDDSYDHEEGDNIRQIEDEPLLFELINLEPKEAEANAWSIGDLIALVFDTDCDSPLYSSDGHNDHDMCHGIAQDGRMIGSTVYYFGLAWELPEGTSNAIQSDLLGGDIRFEVEQQRNNDLPFTN